MADGLIGGFLAPFLGGQLAASRSFTGPDPNTLIENDKVSMTPETFKSTFDEDYRSNHRLRSAMMAYRHKYQPQNSTGYILGSEVGRPLYDNVRSGMNRYFGMGPWAAAALGGIGGAGLGALGTMGWNAFSDRQLNPKAVATLSALLGASVGGLGGYVNRRVRQGQFEPNIAERKHVKPEDYDAQIQQVMGKIASWRDSFTREDKQERNMIMQMLQQAPGMSFNERAHLMQGVNQLSVQDLSQLANMLGMAGGAAVGAIISRFLIGKGLVSTLLGAVTGGIIGSSLFGNTPSQQTTFGGQPLGRFI